MTAVAVHILGRLELDAGDGQQRHQLRPPNSPMADLILGKLAWTQKPARHSDLIEMLWNRGDWDAIWSAESHPDPEEQALCKSHIRKHTKLLGARISDARGPFRGVLAPDDVLTLLFTKRKSRQDTWVPKGTLELSRRYQDLTVDSDRFLELAKAPSSGEKIAALELIEGPILDGIEERLPDHVDLSWLWEARAEQWALIEGLVEDLVGHGGAELDIIVEQIYTHGETTSLSAAIDAGNGFNLAAFRAPISAKHSDLLQEHAGEDFRNLVRIWTGHDDPLDEPLENYKRLQLESWWSAVGPTNTIWRLAVLSEPEHVDSLALGCACLRWEPNPQELEDLRALCEEPAAVLLALAVPKDPDLEPSQILGQPPGLRFDWYCVDIEQFLRHDAAAERPGSILVPLRNELNLSLFSLLWGAHWVKGFFAPLNNPALAETPQLAHLAHAVYSASPDPSAAIAKMGWNFFDKELPSYATAFDSDEFPTISFRLGLGVALHLIRGQLVEDIDRLKVIRNYCPEALFGTINLWLFARSYHGFMLQSAQVATNHAALFTNQRLLPLAANSVRETPHMLRMAAWNVVLCYRQLYASISLVQKPAAGVAGEDHSFYGGGGIGYFPWIKLAMDGASWMIEAEDRGTEEEHVDFLDEQSQNEKAIIAPSHSLADVGHTLNIIPRWLAPPHHVPVLLFPPEDRFLAYPKWLWGPGVQGALMPRGR